MEKLDESLKKELSFDLYGRYAVMRDIINQNRDNGQPFKVLDVGGRGNLMRKFLPKDKVFYLDPYVNTDDSNYIKGNGCAIPLKDNSFDWVVSADVFEHIPENRRNDFLNENIRVAKLGAILAAPFYSKGVERAEIIANESYKKLTSGRDHVWLKEHIENKLPKEKELEDFLNLKKISFQKIHNNRLFLWETLMISSLFFSENYSDEIAREIKKFNLFYNTDIFPFDNQEPSYRKIYFAKKNKDLKDLKIIEKSINDSLFLKAIGKSFNIVSKINVDQKKIIEQKNNHIFTIKEQSQTKLRQLNQIINDLEEKNGKLEDSEERILSLENILMQKEHELQIVKASKFWKLRERYLKTKQLKPKSILKIQQDAFRVLKEKGPKRFLWCIPKYFLHGKEYFIKKEKPVTDYNIWMKKNENWDTKKIKENIKKFNYKPKVSIITPVYNVDPVWLNKCIGSVKNQFYTNWELCLWDDASTKKETIACLKKWKGINDKRIKIGFGKKNEHICGASNNAIKMATGKFIALLDNDDELSPDALYENIKIINKKSEAKFIYSDEDKMELDNNRTEPFFKPNWSPDLLYSNNYICHLTFFKKSLGDKIGWFRKGYEGAQDYDLILRLTEQLKNEEIFHISKILYHWRKIPGSTAENFSFKNYANLAGKKALRDFMKRNKVKGVIESGKFSGSYRIKRKITNQEKVSIIIPFRDQLKVLKKCITSILEKTIYQNFEIVLVNNQSQEKNTLKYLEKISKKNSIKLLNYDKPFNFSAINNYAVSQTDAPYILFLNNDTSVINYGWLGAMIEHIQREEVGAVGAKLLYPNNTIQHAGVVMGLGIASHPFLGFPKRDNGYFGFLNVTKNYSAVTAACLLTKRQLFNELGGFDEKNLGVAYNDVDYCLRLRERGFLITYTPYAKLYHYESLSRGFDNEDDIKKKDPKKYQRIISERKYMLEKWKKVIKNDPYYNPNLTRLQNNFGIKIGPEDVRYI